MSVIVKGMKMPDSCYHCKIAENCGHYIANYTDRRHPDCPLIALPDKHGRLVDADALEKILEKIPAADIKNMGGQAYVLVKLSQVFNVIDNQPTIEPRKKGKWIAHPDDTFDEWFCCSVCHKGLTMFDGTYNFCPNCGADMREPEDIPMEYFESGGR